MAHYILHFCFRCQMQVRQAEVSCPNCGAHVSGRTPPATGWIVTTMDEDNAKAFVAVPDSELELSDLTRVEDAL